MTGRQFLGLLENCPGLGHISQGKIFLHRQRIYVTPQFPMGQQRLQFRAKQNQTVVQHGVVHRLDAHPVARHEKRLLVTVP